MAPPIIHIVDDDASFRGAVGDLLSACGYRVSLWDSAEPFVATISDNETSCIILDVQMAGLSGPQVQSRLVAEGLNLPIIFISGYADVPTAVHAMREGAEDFLTKPVIKVVLLEAIDRALSRYQISKSARWTVGDASVALYPDSRVESATSSRSWFVASLISRLHISWVRQKEPLNCTDIILCKKSRFNHLRNSR